MSLAIYFCGAGTTGGNLANKLHKWMESPLGGASSMTICPGVEPLNSLTVDDLSADKINLLIVSSTEKGEVPAN